MPTQPFSTMWITGITIAAILDLLETAAGGQYNVINSGPISNGASGDVGTLLTNHELEFQTCVVNASCFFIAKEAICDCEDFNDLGKCFVRKLEQKAEELESSDTRISACLESPVPNRINVTGYKLDCHVFGLRDFTFSVNVALTGRNCTQRSGKCYKATLSQRPCTLYVKRGMDVGDRTRPSPIITGLGVLLVGSIITAVLCSCDRTEQDDVYVFDAELNKFTLAKNII
ncbi:Hypp5828 [Branchiostoma lanceolatum]|uniref:Hypp5828 protein n=1 Tax=Branchiostoma lanceolatum TaxID=7740 RepID=A0A8J9YRT0_BRALA|nr:Hypp5828 [Branchiostoma lanceolatum]